MKRILTALVIGLSLIFGTAQADYLMAEDEMAFGQKNYFLIIASEKSAGLNRETFHEDRLKIRKKYEEICNDQVMVWHTGLISSTKPKWGKGYWFVFSFVSDSKFSVSSANKNSCVLKGSYVKSGTPIEYEQRLTKTAEPINKVSDIYHTCEGILQKSIRECIIKYGKKLILQGNATNITVQEGGKFILQGVVSGTLINNGVTIVQGKVSNLIARSGRTDIQGIVDKLSGPGKVKIHAGSIVGGKRY
jgi:hypothetical protein